MHPLTSIDEAIIAEIRQDAEKTRVWAFVLMSSGLFIQIFHAFDLPIIGLKSMLILFGSILFISGILFYLGSYSVPTNRREIIDRFQKIMLDKKPDRRLWAAQRLVGYLKDANLTKEEIINIIRYTKKQVEQSSVSMHLQPYISADHVVLLREIAVSVPMNKHIRKEFVRIIKPLQKLQGFPDEVYELLADAIAYHPSKLAVQAYLDYNKENKDS